MNIHTLIVCKKIFGHFLRLLPIVQRSARKNYHEKSTNSNGSPTIGWSKSKRPRFWHNGNIMLVWRIVTFNNSWFDVMSWPFHSLKKWKKGKYYTPVFCTQICGLKWEKKCNFGRMHTMILLLSGSMTKINFLWFFFQLKHQRQRSLGDEEKI